LCDHSSTTQFNVRDSIFKINYLFIFEFALPLVTSVALRTLRNAVLQNCTFNAAFAVRDADDDGR